MNIQKVNIYNMVRLLADIDAVVSEGSVTCAADRLGMSQPVVSYARMPGEPLRPDAQIRRRDQTRPVGSVHFACVPEHVSSDNSPEFVAKVVQEWIRAVGVKTAYIVPGSP